MDVKSQLTIALLEEQVEDVQTDRLAMEHGLTASKAYLEAIPAMLRGQYWKETYNAVCEALGIE